MPVENEIPWVLDDPDATLENHMSASPDWQGFDVVQGYASKNARVRRFTPLDGGEPKHEFSYKQKVDGRQIEVEVPMSASDFATLLGTCSLVMNKRRFKREIGAVTWDVDFCKDRSGRTYFVRAEAEMPEGTADCGRMPACVAEHVIVPCATSAPPRPRWRRSGKRRARRDTSLVRIRPHMRKSRTFPNSWQLDSPRLDAFLLPVYVLPMSAYVTFRRFRRFRAHREVGAR
jgi:hypothetical protein